MNRPIGFIGSHTAPVNLTIRPEELTRFEPSRLAVQSTLGGAWADSFDRGIATIKISGHTGWRGAGAAGLGLGGLSGEAQFQTLRTNAFVGWHNARAQIVASGGDPSVVTLTFVDTLNLFSDIVAPKSFTLRRSKSRPLLMMYSIEMLVLDDAASPLAAATGVIQGLANGVLAQAAQIENAAATISAGINAALGVVGL